MPSPAKNSRVPSEIGAAPVAANSSLSSPNAPLTLLITSLLARFRENPDTACPSAISFCTAASSTPRAQPASHAFRPLASPSLASSAAWNFSHTRGTARNTVGCSATRLSLMALMSGQNATCPPSRIDRKLVITCSATWHRGR